MADIYQCDSGDCSFETGKVNVCYKKKKKINQNNNRRLKKSFKLLCWLRDGVFKIYTSQIQGGHKTETSGSLVVVVLKRTVLVLNDIIILKSLLKGKFLWHFCTYWCREELKWFKSICRMIKKPVALVKFRESS